MQIYFPLLKGLVWIAESSVPPSDSGIQSLFLATTLTSSFQDHYGVRINMKWHISSLMLQLISDTHLLCQHCLT